MYNEHRLYDLSFVSSKKEPWRKPQIVFSMQARHLQELNTRLHILVSRCEGPVKRYFDEGRNFWYIEKDLFGNAEFGFNRCGIATFTEEEVELRIWLSQAWLRSAALTIHFLAHALCVPIGEPSNRAHQLDLETICESGRHSGYGHAVGGYVSPTMITWLQEQASTAPKECGRLEGPQQVVKAMQEAWCAVMPMESRRYARECAARIYRDGRFILECAGNACDVAIYPDSHPLDAECGVRFSCHNLDTAHQQITLIAGLAKLCELAREKKGGD